MAKTKDSVILYQSFFEASKDLKMAAKAELWDCIGDYLADQKHKFKNASAELAWNFIKLQLDADKKKWATTCAKRSEAGRAGMAQRWAKADEESITNDNKAITNITNDNKAITKITNITDTDTESESESESDKGGETRAHARDDFCDDSIPTLEQVKAFAKDPTVNVSEIEAERFFYRRDGERWLDKNGRIINWRASLRGWRCSPYYGKEAQQQSGARASPCVDEYSLTRAFEWYENHFLGDYDADPKTKEQLEQWATTNGIYERLRNRNDVLYKHVYKIK